MPIWAWPDRGGLVMPIRVCQGSSWRDPPCRSSGRDLIRRSSCMCGSHIQLAAHLPRPSRKRPPAQCRACGVRTPTVRGGQGRRSGPPNGGTLATPIGGAASPVCGEVAPEVGGLPVRPVGGRKGLGGDAAQVMESRRLRSPADIDELCPKEDRSRRRSQSTLCTALGRCGSWTIRLQRPRGASDSSRKWHRAWGAPWP